MAIAFLGSVTGSTTNGLSLTLTIPTSARVADALVLTMSSATRAGAVLLVTSSDGTAYTDVGTFQSSAGTNRVRVQYRRITSTQSDTTFTCSGTGNGQDAVAYGALIFSGVDTGTPIDVTATSTNGVSTTPDSPSITVASCGCAIVSAFSSPVADTAVTAPTSFLNAISTSQNDTVDTVAGMAWITNGTTAAYDPTSWSGVISGAWAAATIALRPASTAEVTTVHSFSPFIFPSRYGRHEIVAY